MNEKWSEKVKERQLQRIGEKIPYAPLPFFFLYPSRLSHSRGAFLILFLLFLFFRERRQPPKRKKRKKEKGK